MNDLNPATPPAGTLAGAAGGSPADEGNEPETDDWDTGPPRRTMSHAPAPCEPLDGLSPAEMSAAYVRLINRLVEKTYPLGLEYLSNACEFAPDNPHRERLVKTGCKLATVANQLINTAARLNKGD